MHSTKTDREKKLKAIHSHAVQTEHKSLLQHYVKTISSFHKFTHPTKEGVELQDRDIFLGQEKVERMKEKLTIDILLCECFIVVGRQEFKNFE